MRYGYGMASVRFICGTQTVHKELESELSRFLGTEDTILYSSCFDANGGLFETILDEQDCVISDALNHASIIDGIRLSKARRLRYDNNDMAQLEHRLQEAADARYRLIATDGVFSMDGVIADLAAICDLADQYDAMVMVDDSHAVGFLGPGGRGTPEHCGVMDRVDIVTGTLGKAMGGASGGYTSGRQEIIDWLRQRSRPYLFSNSLAPVIAATTLQVLDLLQSAHDLQHQLERNAQRFRAGMAAAGFTLAGAGHPIIPVMLGDARVAVEMADRLLAEGVFVIAFSFPVVPQDRARIRTQMSAAHSDDDIDHGHRRVHRGRTRDGGGLVKALVKARPEPGLWLDEVAVPTPGDGDVLIRVRKTSICGTDLHIHRWDAWAQATIPVPMVIGHEFMGEIAAVGADVVGLEVGQRVAGEGHITCGHCRNCKGGRREFCHNHISVGVTRPGAFAEYVVHPGPERLRRARPHRRQRRRGARPARQRHAHLVALRRRRRGCADHRRRTDRGAWPRPSCATSELATSWSPTSTATGSTWPPSSARARGRDVRTEQLAPVMTELGMTEGFDVGLEMSGAESAFNQMLDAMNHGGRIAVLGHPGRPDDTRHQRRDLQGSRDPGDLRAADLRDLVQDGRDAAERTRRQRHHHPRAAGRPIRRSLRHRPQR